MSYQVLARKWRPQTFQQVIGQSHVLTALENGLTQDRVHHAYLFSGTRGVGKTTIARVFAKSLNCEIGVTATPCGKCANCIAIDQGRFVDLLEIDAASRTKVDDTRELLDNVQYKPAQGRYKVYLIDEVHMLSKHSFNALLKTLEEPPEYVKFLLATTDPQKLPITVLSRCLQFHLKAILPEQIEQQLVSILAQEGARYEQGALGVIAKAADGSMRDALSLTDQALAFGAGNIQYAAVLKMLGTIDQSHLHYLLHFIASGNSQKVFEKIQEFVHLGADFSALHQELASLCHQIALMQLQLNANVTEKTAVQLLAERLTPEEVQLFYQIALQGYKDYAFAPNGKVALEMTVMRLLAFKPANYVDIDESMLRQAQQVEAVVSATATESASLIPPPVKESAETQAQVASIIEPKAEQHIQSVAIEQEDGIVVDQVAFPIVNDRESSLQEQQENFQAGPERESRVVANEEQNSVAAQHVQSMDIELQSSAQTNESQQEVIQAITPLNNTMLENNIAESIATVAPVENVSEPQISLETSNSRNMLRSHRLKREELKKTQAVADPLTEINSQSTATLTSNDPVSSAPIIEQVTSDPLAKAKPIVAVNNIDKKIDNAQELPPISSYQDHSSDQNTSDYEPDYLENNVEIQSATKYGVPSDNTLIEKDDQQNVELSYSQPPTLPVVKPLVSQAVVNNDISALHQNEQSTTEVTLIDNGNLEAVEVDVASYVDDKMTDAWFLDIKAMQLVGFEKLLAKSTVMQKNAQKIILSLHKSQQHLLNNQVLCEDLKAKLRQYYGQEHLVDIVAGEVPGNHTPMELELIVYQQYLDDAKSSIKEDPIVKTLVQDYAAKVYENSVVPL